MNAYDLVIVGGGPAGLAAAVAAYDAGIRGQHLLHGFCLISIHFAPKIVQCHFLHVFPSFLQLILDFSP